MNADTRRYLDEDWLDEADVKEAQLERERRNEERPPPDPRQQKQKAWGKATAKFLRDRSKTTQKP